MNKVFPLCFVLLWSSAFISSKIIVGEATPFASLAFRFGFVSLGFALYSFYQNYKFTSSFKNIFEAAGTGILFHGFYLGGSFFALSKGFPAGIVALIVSLQPILTTILARPLLGEKITRKQWLGIFLGFSGTIIVLGFDFSESLQIIGIMSTIIALLASTAGTLWQKKLSGKLPLPINSMYQALSACFFHILVMYFFEISFINFSSNFIFAMSWQVFIISFAAFTIFMYLIKTGSASGTSSLFFLVPPVSAIMAWLFLDENLFFMDIVGLLIATIGVYISTRTYNNTVK